MSDRTRAGSLPRTMTAEAYRKLPETNQPMELIDGEVVMSPAPKYTHQRLFAKLHLLLAGIVPEGELVLAPSDLHLDEGNVLQPDIFWVSKDNERCRLVDDDWHGAPDLVVEILSPGTAVRDRKVKFAIYQQHGVREYWMVEPYAGSVEVWRLENGEFRRFGVFGQDESFVSAVLGGRELKLADIFK